MNRAARAFLMRGRYADEWGTGRAFKAMPVRDLLVELVDREPGITQAEAARRLGRNISSTVALAVRAGVLRRELRTDRHAAYALYPAAVADLPVNGNVPRPNPVMLPWRQRDVLALMVDAGRPLAVADVVALVRDRDPTATYRAVKAAVTHLTERHALKRRADRGRYLYRPKANALQWLDVLDDPDW